MELGLRGKTALITGASAGIGAAAARAFAAEGARLVLVARTRAKLEALRDELREGGGEAEIHACDLSSAGEIERLAASHRAVDIVVNNAGAVPSGSLFDVDDARWRQGWDSKVFPYVAMCRAYYPLLKQRGGGVIVNVLGNGSLLMNFDYLCGGMANAALDFMTKTLGARGPRDGIRVVGISPGPVDTERYRAIADARQAQGIRPDHPFGRIASPAEIAAQIAFAASERSAYVSGTIIVVDAGASASRVSPPSSR